MKQRRKRRVCFLLALILAVLLIPQTALSADGRTVRVGVFPLGNFHKIDESGNPVGYDIDYLNRVQEYTHWKIEYVEADNWTDALHMLDEGKIDIVAPAQKTKDREDKYLFSAFSMSTELGAVVALPDREDLQYEDFEKMAGLQYGAMESSPLTDAFLNSYAAAAGFEPKVTYYKNMTSLFTALQEKEVDAIATNIMLVDDNVKMIGRYSPSPVYYIAGRDNTAIMNELDDAMTDLRLDDPGFESNLFAEYFPSLSNASLTHKELEYVSTLKESVVIGYEDNHAPVSYTDEETGEFAGITRDILDAISESSGISFQYVELPEGEVSYDVIKKEQIHVVSGVEYNDINSSAKGIRLTSPYLSSEKVFVTENQEEFSSTSTFSVALAAGSQTLEKVIMDEYPKAKIQKYATVEECLDAVEEGKADTSLQNRYVAECALSNPHYENLTIMPVTSLSDELCLGMMDYEDEGLDLDYGLFRTIVDKSIKNLSKDDLNKIILKNTSKSRYHVTMWDVIKKNKLALAALTVLIIACMLMLTWKQQLEKAKAHELEEKNDALRDAVSQAEKANRAKSQFLSRMSHEIRTPMNAIVGITAIAKRHKEEPTQVEDYLNKIDSSSHVLLNIINDVLDMSAIESDKLKIANAKFDIKQILNNIATVYYSQCQNKGIQFNMITDIQDETLIGDSLRVNQILMNLVSNAYKFTPEGGSITISVKETAHRGDKIYLEFVVADTGCGMSRDMQERLFRPFEQESAVTAQAHGGSGLGLSITKNLVDMMHGAVRVESEKEKGTTFTVDIPFEDAGEDTAGDTERLKEIRALIVDDDFSAAEYTSIVLNRIGVQYEIAHSGAEAVRMATAEHQAGRGFDVCFIDMRMPGMDGIEATREIRRMFDKDTLIIIVSAYDPSEVESDAKAAGADMFVAKPLFQSTVFNLLMTRSGGKYKKESADIRNFDFEGRCILLAEDNALNREIAVDLLELVNLKVDCAENGQEAVDKFEAAQPGRYDAILMDIQMPLMDGFEATKRIRASKKENGGTIPIFAMTANAFAEDVSASLNAGMNGHISKPIDTQILYQTLYRAFMEEKE